jgi:hypothetical protein
MVGPPSSFFYQYLILFIIRLRVQVGSDVESLLDDGALFVQGDAFLKGMREGRPAEATTHQLNAGTHAGT